jgi:hypothetical protein
MQALDPYKQWLERDNIALKRVHNSLLQRYQAAEEELNGLKKAGSFVSHNLHFATQKKGA